MLQRGQPRGASHLRQVSAASIESISNSVGGGASSLLASAPAPPSLIYGEGSDKDSLNSSRAYQHVPSLYRHPCTLWVHDEKFSREDVLFNNSAFNDGSVRLGDVIEITHAPVGRVGGTGGAFGPAGGGPGLGGGGGVTSIESGIGADPSKPEYGGTVRSLTITESTTDPGSAGLHHATHSKFSTSTQGRFLFIVKPGLTDINKRQPRLDISVASSVANICGFKSRMQVLLSVVDRSQCRASHVDLVFRDQYLMRSDMWRLVTSEMVDKAIYKGQKIVSMGTVKATIKNIFIGGKKVLSGYFAPDTLPVFRSESARFVLFIQMSREMWDFDAEGTGDILFSRVIDGFLPELFKRWVNLDAKHLVTIVLFTRVEYNMNTGEYGSSSLSMDALKHIFVNPTDQLHSRDFYRVVVNDIASGHWTTILDELKKNFRTFLRDVSIQNCDKLDPNNEDPDQNGQCTSITGHPTSALRGNILEAIRLASSHLSYDNVDCDMARTGTSIVVITPGTGLFEVSYDSLLSTTEALSNLGIAIDLVCLSPMPLHSVPLFKYRKPRDRASSPQQGDLGLHSSTDNQSSCFNNLSHRLSPKSPEFSTPSRPHPRSQAFIGSSEWSYGIPHWLDISFWNPRTYRQGRRITNKDLNAPIPFTLSKSSKQFVPRVRMYEIQMMGVMESEQSNISIPYLSEKTYGLQRPLTTHPVLSSHLLTSPANRFPFSPGSFTGQLSDSLRPETFLPSFAGPKDVILPGSAKYQKRMLSWMDEYDDNVFHTTPKNRRPRKYGKGGRQLRVDGHTTQAKERLLDKKEHEENNAEPTPAASKQHKIERVPAPPSRSTISTKQLTPIKPSLKSSRAPRISRSISFALRGLGSAPPRAEASTEVNAEHVKALPITNRKTSAISIKFENKGPLPSVDDAASNTSTNESPSGPPTPKTPKKMSGHIDIPQTRPISIKAASQKTQDGLSAENLGRGGSFNTSEMVFQTRNHSGGQGPFPMTRVTSKLDIDMKAGQNDTSTNQSPNKALAPWIRSINPSNTPRASLRDASWFGHWQHAYPRPPHVALVKWKSLKSPAVLPLTTEEFPSIRELASDYVQAPYRVAPNDDVDAHDGNKTRDILLREMVALRLAHGFQIIIGNSVARAFGQHMLETLNVFDQRGLGRDGATVILSKGNVIHRLNCVAGGEIEVTLYSRQVKTALIVDKPTTPLVYTAAIRTILSRKYEVNNISLPTPKEDYNWNYADNYLAGHRDHLMNPSKQLRFWRTRYVLIPMRLSANVRRHMSAFSEDNEEEIHLLGINQLTHLWQRYKYTPSEEKRFQTVTRKKKEQNPLNILYQTRDLSEIVTAELDRILLTDPGLDNPPAQLLPDSELLERSSINLSTLAQTIQGDKGVRMMDRRWHLRLHYNCFIGSEFTTWLLQNFRDIDTREDAVEFGKELLKHGLFQHVEQRHNFRDGNYFYQLASDYRAARPESRAGAGWFQSRRHDKSVPSTPAVEASRDPPLVGDKVALQTTEEAEIPSTTTPSKPKSKVQIYLSKSMRYDVDPRKRSHRPEVIDLHYDRLHNPENCFHIELSWMCATPKLVEDAVASWALAAERHGLKLVQMPIAESSALVKKQPFRSLYRVKLKVKPPRVPVSLSYTATSFNQPSNPDKHYFQKAILRKFDFVLDFEAASAFSPDVEVFYSWGKLDYHYTQYVHRSGCLVAQISDDGDFYFFANRLFSTKSAANREAAKFDRNERGDTLRLRNATYAYDPMFSPRLSPMIRPLPENINGASINNCTNTSVYSPSPSSSIFFSTDPANLYRSPEFLKTQVEEFCNDADRLQQFYKEALVRPLSTKVGSSVAPPSVSPAVTGVNTSATSTSGPVTPNTFSVIDASIPSLELPASIVFNQDTGVFQPLEVSLSAGIRVSSASSAAAAATTTTVTNDDGTIDVEYPIAEAMAGSIPSGSKIPSNFNGKGASAASPASGDINPITDSDGNNRKKENSGDGNVVKTSPPTSTMILTSTPTTLTGTSFPYLPSPLIKGGRAGTPRTTVATLTPHNVSPREPLELPLVAIAHRGTSESSPPSTSTSTG